MWFDIEGPSWGPKRNSMREERSRVNDSSTGSTNDSGVDSSVTEVRVLAGMQTDEAIATVT